MSLSILGSRSQIHLPFPSHPLPRPDPSPSAFLCNPLCSDVISHVLFLSSSGRTEEDHDHDLLCYPCDHLSFYYWGHICLKRTKKVSHLWGAAADSSRVLLSIVKPRMTQHLNHLPIQTDAKGDLGEYGLGRQAGRLGREYGTLRWVRKAVRGGERIGRRPVRKWTRSWSPLTSAVGGRASPRGVTRSGRCCFCTSGSGSHL